MSKANSCSSHTPLHTHKDESGSFVQFILSDYNTDFYSSHSLQMFGLHTVQMLFTEKLLFRVFWHVDPTNTSSSNCLKLPNITVIFTLTQQNAMTTGIFVRMNSHLYAITVYNWSRNLAPDQSNNHTNVDQVTGNCGSLFAHLNKTCKNVTVTYISQLTLHKNPPFLVTLAMSDKQWHAHTTHHVLTK